MNLKFYFFVYYFTAFSRCIYGTLVAIYMQQAKLMTPQKKNETMVLSEKNGF